MSDEFDLQKFVDKVLEQTRTHDYPDVAFGELGELIALARKGLIADETARRAQKRLDVFLYGALKASGGELTIYDYDLCDFGCGEAVEMSYNACEDKRTYRLKAARTPNPKASP